jgi:predicted nucleic acid-binding protein
VILVDANVLMYAAGGRHRHQAASARFVERVAAGRVEAALDAEVLQEILHRYRALRRWKEGRALFDLARQVFSVVIPVTVEVLDRARLLLDDYGALKARDAVHAAVVLENDLEAICSFDRDFDAIEGLRRKEPS